VTLKKKYGCSLYGHTIATLVEIDSIKVNTLLYSGAANSIINPRLLADMPASANLDVLDYSYQYGSAVPDAYIVSQGCVTGVCLLFSSSTHCL